MLFDGISCCGISLLCGVYRSGFCVIPDAVSVSHLRDLTILLDSADQVTLDSEMLCHSYCTELFRRSGRRIFIQTKWGLVVSIQEVFEPSIDNDVLC